MPYDPYNDYESEMEHERDVALDAYVKALDDLEEAERVLSETALAFKEAAPDEFEKLAGREGSVLLYV